jgi:putative ABC transport system permease protein
VFRLTFRNVWDHKVRFLLTTFAVVIGVGFVVGSFVVSNSLRGSVDQLFAEVTEGIDVAVRAETELEANNAPAPRGRIPESLLRVVQEVDGVEVAEKSVGGYAQLLDLEGEPMTTTGAPFLGVSWGRDPRLRPATLDEGREPFGFHEVAIDRGTAKDYGFEVGDRTTVILGDGSTPEVEIVGIFTFGTANNLLGARLTAFDVEVSQKVFGAGSTVDEIDVIAAPGVDPGELAVRIQEVLPAGTEALTGDEMASEGRDAVAGLLSGFRNILLGFAGVSLFVAAFFINNTFSIVVGQRTRQLALLRAVGASERQITVSVVGEAIVVGLLASVLGIAFGLVIAVALQALLNAAGFGLPKQQLELAAPTVLAAFIVGVGITMLASLSPARRASSVPPVQGMREGWVPHRWSRGRRGVLGFTLTAIGAAAMVTALWAVEGTMRVVGLLAAGAVLCFIGIAQLSPVVAVPVAGRLGRPIVPVFRVAGRLAHSNAVRNPERTAKTASALMIGLALVTTVFIVGTSMKETFADSIEDSVSADFILSTQGFIGFSPSLTEAVEELPEISAVSGARFAPFLVEGKQRDLVAGEASELAQVLDIDVQSGDLADLDEDAIFLHEDPARDLDLSVGDEMTIELGAGGPREVVVAGIYADAAYAGNYLIDLSLFTEGYPTVTMDMFAFARLADGVDPAQGHDAIAAVLSEHPEVQLDDRTGFQADQEEQFDSILLAINGLLALALFIALLGIANTLALSVLERTREIGLLRAVGMLRRQAREMVVAESVMVAVFGAVLGVAIGVAFGLAIALALPPSMVTTTAIPVSTIAVIVVVAAICGILAGMLPARRAARLDVLRAIATE